VQPPPSYFLHKATAKARSYRRACRVISGLTETLPYPLPRSSRVLARPSPCCPSKGTNEDSKDECRKSPRGWGEAAYDLNVLLEISGRFSYSTRDARRMSPANGLLNMVKQCYDSLRRAALGRAQDFHHQHDCTQCNKPFETPLCNPREASALRPPQFLRCGE
jgi:hypothetical protein